MKFILASKSPRRSEILKKFGYDFLVRTSDFTETGNNCSPIDTVVGFAKGKALSVFDKLTSYEKQRFPVIGADTVVYFDGKILGKPKDKEDAKKTLLDLSGRKHSVYTGYAVMTEDFLKFGYDETEVIFNHLSKKLIEEYVATGSPMDKAGSYGIQDEFDLVKEINGSLYNVIGFPIEKISPILEEIKKTSHKGKK